AHAFTASGEADHGARHHDTGNGDGAHEIDTVNAWVAGKRRTFSRDKQVDRYRIRMAWQVGERGEHAGAVRNFFTHAKDAAAAGLHASIAHGTECIEAILIGACGD